VEKVSFEPACTAENVDLDGDFMFSHRHISQCLKLQRILELNGSMKEPNKFHNYETEKNHS